MLQSPRALRELADSKDATAKEYIDRAEAAKTDKERDRWVNAASRYWNEAQELRRRADSKSTTRRL